MNFKLAKTITKVGNFIKGLSSTVSEAANVAKKGELTLKNSSSFGTPGDLTSREQLKTNASTRLLDTKTLSLSDRKNIQKKADQIREEQKYKMANMNTYGKGNTYSSTYGSTYGKGNTYGSTYGSTYGKGNTYSSYGNYGGYSYK
ncbi:MAG: hypothetical protein LBI95_01255 [Holosporales bacterium]|nr:hypothetical protein [Holosporales bacterium]